MAMLADMARDRLAGTATKIEHGSTGRDECAKAIQPSAFMKAAFPQPCIDPGVGVPLVDVDDALGVGIGAHGGKATTRETAAQWLFLDDRGSCEFDGARACCERRRSM
jgi:hypothetical protein